MNTIDIGIDAWQVLSPLGASAEETWDTYTTGRSVFQTRTFGHQTFPVAPLHLSAQKMVEEISHHPEYKNLDPAVHYALAAARGLLSELKGFEKEQTGLNLASSRGATHTFERCHQDFVSGSPLSPLSSPLTTAGNLSSWVARELGLRGFAMSHSITCSSALHAVINAVAWLKSGLHTQFLAGSTEACLTPFTLAQMNRLKVLSSESSPFPCQALNFNKKSNTMVLGDGAGIFALSSTSSSPFRISGLGFAIEKISNATSISKEGEGFYQSMKKALGTLNPEEIDLVVMHAPGTLQGDRAEFQAVSKLFGPDLPHLYSPKYFAGHALGASGALGLEAGLLMMKKGIYLSMPTYPQRQRNSRPTNTLINAMGFGGNAATLRISYRG